MYNIYYCKTFVEHTRVFQGFCTLRTPNASLLTVEPISIAHDLKQHATLRQTVLAALSPGTRVIRHKFQPLRHVLPLAVV